MWSTQKLFEYVGKSYAFRLVSFKSFKSATAVRHSIRRLASSTRRTVCPRADSNANHLRVSQVYYANTLPLRHHRHQFLVQFTPLFVSITYCFESLQYSATCLAVHTQGCLKKRRRCVGGKFPCDSSKVIKRVMFSLITL